MKTVIQTESAEAELKNWLGAEATLWMYHATFKRLAIMLSTPDRKEVLYVIAVGCRHITGPFSWDDANITIHNSSANKTMESAVRIIDELAPFELICSSVILARARAEDFDTSFNSFLGEDSDHGEET
ncbi:hypothetical protein [Sorangium sp. So ce1097]|uniref:hypothetical protein n=1 Tax=Sorangium sp. So ce1097 TaxID=3133330 RepID=UPI003F62AA61